jgi:hypothetical protein
MDPASLMKTLMDVVPGIKIATQHALEILPDQLLDDFSGPRMMVFVIADGGSGDAPDIAVDAIFSPSGFICLHRRAGADLCFQGIEHGLYVLLHPMRASPRVLPD